MTLPRLRHHFFVGDVVRRADGIEGQVLETTALYALIRWSDELRTWIDQHDSAVEIIERGSQVTSAA